MSDEEIKEECPDTLFCEEEQMLMVTPSYVLKKTGINLHKVLKPGFIDGPQKRAEFFIRQAIADIYTHVYDCNANNNWQTRIMNTCEWFKKNVFLLAQLEQIQYVLASGRSVLYSGQNFKTGDQMDIDQIARAGISPRTKQLLDKTIPYLGHSITYRGAFNPLRFW